MSSSAIPRLPTVARRAARSSEIVTRDPRARGASTNSASARSTTPLLCNSPPPRFCYRGVEVQRVHESTLKESDQSVTNYLIESPPVRDQSLTGRQRSQTSNSSSMVEGCRKKSWPAWVAAAAVDGCGSPATLHPSETRTAKLIRCPGNSPSPEPQGRRPEPGPRSPLVGF